MTGGNGKPPDNIVRSGWENEQYRKDLFGGRRYLAPALISNCSWFPGACTTSKD